MLLIPRNNLYNKINKFLKGGPAYFKSYGINSDKFKSMFNALRTRGFSNQVAFEITLQSLKEVPNGYYSFGSRFDNVNSWADNVVNHQLKRPIYKNAVNATNFLEYRNSTLPYNKLPGYTRWLLEGRSQGKDFINQYIEENNLGLPVVMNNFNLDDVLYAQKGGIVKALTGWTAYFNPKNWGVSRYDTDEDGNLRTFSLAYGAARNDGAKEFLWNNNRYSTEFKYVPASGPAQSYNDMRALYILAIENPNRIGYDQAKDRWTPPTNSRIYDTNQIGIGLDMNTNNRVKKFLRDNGRTNNPWLTNAEMLQLQSDTLGDLETILDRNLKGLKVSDTKRAIAIGLLYHGYGPKLWNPNGPKTRKLNQALFKGTDQDFINAVTEFYQGNPRSEAHSRFWSK